MHLINKVWDIVLADEFKKDYYKNLGRFIKSEYQTKTIYPSYENIFNALRSTDYNQIKVVIIGQDPYHGENEAHGLCFSVLKGTKLPPSLLNIFKELNSDLNIKRSDGDLTTWANQGVLLLNSIMTVVKDQPLSHKEKGWETFTDAVISKINEKEDPVVFILWGSYARSKKIMINNQKHLIIEGVHPSPLSASRGFFGSKPFSKTNQFLKENNIEEIHW